MAQFPQAANRPFKAFQRDQDGSLIVFSLFMFIGMLMIAGIAVDVMRFENVRVKTQNTIDRAVLAAADLDQTVDPKTVVDDYFVKAGMDILDYEVTVVESKVGDTVVGRRVSANSDVKMGTMFMGMMGIEALDVSSGSIAEESINKIEISMILDVSGSMGSNSKLLNMQNAAKDFLDEIFANNEVDNISISLIPYSTQVNIGETLASQFNLSNEQTDSACVNFASSDFNTPSLSTTQPLERMGHFDRRTSRRSGRAPRDWTCRTESDFIMTPWSNDIIALKQQIEGFTARGNTSIDIGVKWGAAMLDPSLRPVLANLAAGGTVDPALIGRPYSYDDDDALKFMIVMTDGINTSQWRLNSGYRSGPSPYWIDPSNGNLSYFDADRSSSSKYWRQRIGEYRSTPDGGSDAVQLSWPEVWSEMTVNWDAYYMHRNRIDFRNSTYYARRDQVRGYVDAATKDARLSNICSNTRANGRVVVFAVGFEVTDDSAAVMRDCATSDQHFYRVEGLEIGYAFRSIANQINQLKLTQ